LGENIRSNVGRTTSKSSGSAAGLGRYPIPKAPQPAVTDLLELQRSTRPFWIELLNTVEAPLTENQRRDFGTAKQLALGTFEAVASNEEFYDRLTGIHSDRLKQVGTNWV